MSSLGALSGLVVSVGESVRVLLVLEDSVPASPAAFPAVIVTGRPVHMLVCHVLVVSWSVVLVCKEMRYLDVASGAVAHAGETVSVVAVLEVTVLASPAPVPAVILTGSPAHLLVVHALVASWSVVVVPPLAVPVSLVAVPASSLPVPASPVPVPPSRSEEHTSELQSQSNLV